MHPTLAIAAPDWPHFLSEVDPEGVRAHGISLYGETAVEVYEILSQPLHHRSFWNIRGIEGASRFLDALEQLMQQERTLRPQEPFPKYRLHQLLQAYHESLAAAASAEGHPQRLPLQVAMRVTELLLRREDRSLVAALQLLQLLHPILPGLAAEHWQRLGRRYPETSGYDITDLPMPDSEALVIPQVTISVLVNGVHRGRFVAHPKAEALEMLNEALGCASIQAYIGCRSIRQTVILPGRLVHILL
jgi:leucyl-tRNA synthetase